MNHSEITVKIRRNHLNMFVQWCEERAITRPQEVTRAILERYQKLLYHYRKEDGKPLDFHTQSGRLSSIRVFFKWLSKQNHIPYNPASELELPRQAKKLPKAILTESEAESVLKQADINSEIGIRDRAILETFYSTGMRRMELAKLKIYDLDRVRGVVMIREGKGKKDRIIPIGERAIAWIDKYLEEVRPGLIIGSDDGTLFLTKYGQGWNENSLTNLARRYIKQAEIGKAGGCHMLRHTMATLMLEGGADIRFIQEMLGHARLTTTQIYTKVSIKKLKEVHTASHPGAQLGHQAHIEETEEPLTEEQDQ